jgi:hypothetical protein
MWKFFMQFTHIVIAVCFGQDAGCSDGRIFGITFHNAVVRDLFIAGKTISINQQKTRA